MCAAKILPPAALYRRCATGEIPFETTAEATQTADIIGQDRAIDAVRFGIAIAQEGYNLFAIGPQGVGKQTLLRQFLGRQAASAKTPSDWCYVANLADPRRPRALQLPPGLGARLRTDMERAVAELRVAMRSAFESDEYRTRKQQIIGRFKEQQERAFSAIQASARERRVAVVRTDTGLMVAPLRDGSIVEPPDFAQLPEAEQNLLREEMERVGSELQQVFKQVHDWGRQHHEALQELDRSTAARTARRVVDAVRAGFRDLPAVLAYLDEIEKDVVQSSDDFLAPQGEGLEGALHRALHPEPADGASFRRYQVNSIVENAGQQGAPVVFEDNPTHANLFGRVEHVSQFGALVTDFTLLKAGALHRANGGYLVLEALKVLQSPFAWDALKRAIRSRELRVETIGQLMGLMPTLSLEPEPIPLNGTKVVLMGERTLYYLLATLDPDFLELFKVVVDFEETMDRRPESQAVYANLIATLVRKEGLRAMDRGAVARVIEHAARLAGDAAKLSVHMRPIADLVREADFWAGKAGRAVVAAEDVQAALDAQHRRGGRLREQLLEAVQRESILIDTAGEKVGQVNGLSVIQLGESSFGHPTRITARVRMGKGEVIDIEREVELGGPIHSKGVLILSGFLGARYAARVPLTVSASLVFEQSYGGVEGDSASLAELCALLSALADVPIRQSLAMTGSVNQHGQVQPIGGVNEKIEGFYDICRERGLTGEQGVLIPRSNVQNLMLRRDVVEAVEAGRFRIYAVGEVDEAIEILTGREAGARDIERRFPPASVNGLVEARLIAFAEDARAFAAKSTPR